MKEILVLPKSLEKDELVDSMICCSMAINDIYNGGYKTIKELKVYLLELVAMLDNLYKFEQGGDI